VSRDRLLVATTNPGKLREIGPILRDLPYDVVSLDSLPPIESPDETGATFAGNAREKALYYAGATGLLTVAEDSGIEIDALDGEPGVRSARFNGEAYEDKFREIYARLERRTGARASVARFVCVAVLARGGDVLCEARGTVEGRIAATPAGTSGFGYDPILFYPPLDRTLGELDLEIKAAISHRGAAFRQVREYLLRGLGKRVDPGQSSRHDQTTDSS
jgi:XTP/dITP diphosphohydrolase